MTVNTMTKADIRNHRQRLRVLDRRVEDAAARVERRRAPAACPPQHESVDEAARVARLRLQDQVDAVAASHGRPTPERIAQAGDAAVEETITLEDRSRAVAVRMLDTADSDRRRMQALPKVNRWAAETLRRVYLLAHREPVVTGAYGDNRRPGELPEHVAYAEALVSRCCREAGRYWPALRAALVDEGWRVKDERALRTAMRWLAGWWRRVEVTDGERWEDLADALVLRTEDDDAEAPDVAPTPWHLWIMLACKGPGLPVLEVRRFADAMGADRVAVHQQLEAWRRSGVVRLRAEDDGAVWRVW